MFGIIYFWRILPGREAEHADLMRAILDEQRRAAPEVLLLLALGPSPDGEYSEVQLFPSEAAARGFPIRAAREAPRLQELWDRHAETCEPNSLRTHYFEADHYAAGSFVRDRSAIGHLPSADPR